LAAPVALVGIVLMLVKVGACIFRAASRVLKTAFLKDLLLLTGGFLERFLFFEIKVFKLVREGLVIRLGEFLKSPFWV
jgi:hypothetical protein